ncbi:hypothetical protein MXB_2, partial [Myxobolus squamalis]
MDKTKKRKAETESSKPSKVRNQPEEKGKFAKRPMSAFFIFSQSMREDIKKNGGTITGVENVAKMAGKKWNELSETEKKPFADKAKEAKERYDRELASGLKAPPRKTKSSKTKGDKTKDPNKPKRASSAYLFYSADFRKSPDAINIKHTEIMKAAADKWKSLTLDEKKKYTDLELKDKARFQKEIN